MVASSNLAGPTKDYKRYSYKSCSAFSFYSHRGNINYFKEARIRPVFGGVDRNQLPDIALRHLRISFGEVEFAFGLKASQAFVFLPLKLRVSADEADFHPKCSSRACVCRFLRQMTAMLGTSPCRLRRAPMCAHPVRPISSDSPGVVAHPSPALLALQSGAGTCQF